MSVENYDDIINLPHQVSGTHRHMTGRDRAAQFAPFAALVGHSDAINETGRLTDEETEVLEDKIEEINRKIFVALSATEPPKICVSYFEADRKKEGGAYLSHDGVLKKMDVYEDTLEFEDGFKVTLSKIRDINGDIYL
ncbi:MAG: YolD-like family protein [Clostridia bacterium]|nr:YolD-like family protein [Clostridia bacterium]